MTARGYSVLTANNGNDAINLAKSEHPDLIILDIVIPGVGGAEIAEILKENLGTKNIPIIFLTGLLSKKEEEQHGSVFAGNVFIAKPYNIEELLTQIEYLTMTRLAKAQNSHSLCPNKRMTK